MHTRSLRLDFGVFFYQSFLLVCSVSKALHRVDPPPVMCLTPDTICAVFGMSFAIGDQLTSVCGSTNMRRSGYISWVPHCFIIPKSLILCRLALLANPLPLFLSCCAPGVCVCVVVLRLASRSNHFIRGVTTSESGRQSCCAPGVCVCGSSTSCLTE